MPTDQCVNVFSVAARNILLSLILLLIAACGGGGGSNSNNVALQSVAITPTNPSQQLGGMLQLVATGAYSNGTTRDISSIATWSSSKTAVATVSTTGLVSTATIGTSTITATLSGLAGQVTMMVTPAPAMETILHTFGTPSSDGSQPSGSLVQASDGNFYGTTGAGGINSCLSQPNFCGTVYKITPTGVETVLYSFGASASDGFDPIGPLIQLSDGNFYGITGTAGAYGAGTVFKITPTGVETVLYSFRASASDGFSPGASLIQASDGNLYGTTTAGGANSCYGVPNFCGTVYKITPAGVETILYSFGASAADGVEPEGALLQASDGNFYGTTSYGGANTCGQYGNSCGTVFKITPDGVESVLYSFGASRSDGFAPLGSLIQASDGNFYGTTSGGGAHSAGTVFKITPAGVETVLYSFGTSASDGVGPTGSLIQASDGDLYGTTSNGGTNNCLGSSDCGTVFKITLAGVDATLYSFGASASDGSEPGGLIQASDGNFYGVTSRAGVGVALRDTGTVFKLVP